MRVLMFGWEFPPHKSGGLGTACYDLTKGLARQGIEVTFVMPFAPDCAEADFVKLLGTGKWTKKLKFRKIESPLAAYMTSQSYEQNVDGSYEVRGTSGGTIYGKNLYEEVKRFAMIAGEIAAEEPHDVIHVHDWMTYQAGIEAQKRSGKPLVAHMHATEFCRTADNPNGFISNLEYEGMRSADKVITNSEWTKNRVMRFYQLPSDHVRVVHWGIEPDKPEYALQARSPWHGRDPVVLFVGRVTIQKGPDYLIEVAKKVSQYVPNVRFVFVGNGDMLPRIINRAADLGISERVHFTGALKGADVHKAYQMADLFVMPSVSEPFGLVALEAMKNKCPIMISRQSGASEVVSHALKIDFWDVNRMAHNIVQMLRHRPGLEELRINTIRESGKFNLDDPARKVIQVYKEVLK